jgi:hypothetical protein
MMDIKKKFSEMSVLSPLLTLYTVVYMGLMICNFAAHGAVRVQSQAAIA